MAYYFNLPIITELTTDQQAVLNEPKAISVSGGPGTGKSVIALWRHIRNHDSGTRFSLLLTYTKTLELYLASSARTINDDASETVNRTYHWITHEASSDYDEIIIDEAQDVNIHKYHQINTLTPMVSYSADNNQRLFKNGTTEEDLMNIFPNPHYRLRKNFRNSKQISLFVKSMFPDNLIEIGEKESAKPQLICTDGNSEVQTQIILDILETYGGDTHNIAILLPLQAHVQYWYDLISDKGFSCSKYKAEDEEILEIDNIHITTFKSSKGLEFDSVIIPFFNRFEDFIADLNVVKENDYYVIFTRARSNLFLIDNSKTSNKKTNLKFLSLPLSKDLLEVDYSYLDD